MSCLIGKADSQLSVLAEVELVCCRSVELAVVFFSGAYLMLGLARTCIFDLAKSFVSTTYIILQLSLIFCLVLCLVWGFKLSLPQT